MHFDAEFDVLVLSSAQSPTNHFVARGKHNREQQAWLQLCMPAVVTHAMAQLQQILHRFLVMNSINQFFDRGQQIRERL